MQFQSLYRLFFKSASNSSIDWSSTPAAPRFAFTRLYASQTNRLGILHDFALSKRLLPLPVDLPVKLDSVAPSLQFHYRTFVTTTRDSAPVPRFGTRALMGLPLELLPSHRVTGSHVPHKSPNRVHAASPSGRHLSRKQVSLRPIPS